MRDAHPCSVRRGIRATANAEAEQQKTTFQLLHHETTCKSSFVQDKLVSINEAAAVFQIVIYSRLNWQIVCPSTKYESEFRADEKNGGLMLQAICGSLGEF